eukprot:TRINITY_DN67743_c10_g3_i1.p1 TRINITY_DN67743_c10_g3~~TRINITY_DN67743_c10_g3_i1.p1  ORF type:complete len:468 (-),score=62.01 TRINITY_DN67743_c10_g3_i1:179-1420(-)
MKVRTSGLTLDYWIYDINLETNEEMYFDNQGEKVGKLMRISTARRYSEFEWLREELVKAYPGAIVPMLPGLNMQGMLDKVKSLLMPTDDAEPPIVVFRKRGLTLFLEWINGSPTLRSSPLIKGFVQASPQNLTAFKKQWKQSRSQEKGMFDSQFDTLKYTVKKLSKTYVLPNRVIEVRALAETMTTEMSQLKDAVEKLWDLQGIWQTCYPPYPHLKADTVTASLIDTGLALDKALKTRYTDTAYAKLLVLLSFYAGLCKSVLDAVKVIENLTAIYNEAKIDKHPNMERIQANVDRATQLFYDELAHWHSMRRYLCRNIPKKFTWLCTHMDPTLFPWEDKVVPLVDDCDTAYKVSVADHSQRYSQMLQGSPPSSPTNPPKSGDSGLYPAPPSNQGGLHPIASGDNSSSVREDDL